MVRRPSTIVPNEATALPKVIERWWRWRFVAATACAVVGLSAPLRSAFDAAALLLAVAAFTAVVTLCAVALLRHRGDGKPEFSRAVVAATVVCDVGILLLAVRAAPEWAAWLLVTGALVGVAGQLCVVGRLSQPDPRQAQELERLYHSTSEPLGIVRARIDALRIALEAAPLADGIRHDFTVLETQADAAQRALRSFGEQTGASPACSRSPAAARSVGP